MAVRYLFSPFYFNSLPLLSLLPHSSSLIQPWPVPVKIFSTSSSNLTLLRFLTHSHRSEGCGGPDAQAFSHTQESARPPQAPVLSSTSVVFLIYVLSTKTHLSSRDSLWIHKSFVSDYGESSCSSSWFLTAFFLHIHSSIWFFLHDEWRCVIRFQLQCKMNEAGWV